MNKVKNSHLITIKLLIIVSLTSSVIAQKNLPPPGSLFPKTKQNPSMPINQDRAYWEREFLEGSPQSAREFSLEQKKNYNNFINLKNQSSQTDELLKKKIQLYSQPLPKYNQNLAAKVRALASNARSSFDQYMNPTGNVGLIIKGSPINIDESVIWLDYSPSGAMLALPLGDTSQIYNLDNNQYGLNNYITEADQDWLSIFHNRTSPTLDRSTISNQFINDFNLSSNRSLSNKSNQSPINSKLVSAFSNKSTNSPLKISPQFIGSPLLGHQELVYSLAFYPDSSRIVSGGGDGYVRVWDFTNMRQIGLPLEGHNGLVYTVAVSPDGSRLASAGNDGGIRIWNAINGAQELSPLMGHRGDIFALNFSNDSRKLFSAGSDGNIIVWDATNGDQIGKLSGHNSNIYSLDISQDGKYLASAGDDNQIIIWQLDKQEILHTINGIIGDVYALAFNPKGDILASTGNNSHVFLWDVDSGKQFKNSLYTNGNALFSLAFSPDGQQLAAGSYDNLIWIWDGRDFDPNYASPLRGHTGWISSLAFDQSGSYLATASSDKSIRIWQAPIKEITKDTAKLVEVLINAVTNDNSNQFIANQTSQIQNKSTGVNFPNINDFIQNGAAIARSHDGSYWAIADDKIIEQYNSKTNRLRNRIKAHSQISNSKWSKIVYSPNDNIIAAGNNQGQVGIFSTINGKLLSYILAGNARSITAMAVSQNEEWLSIADDLGMILIYQNLNYQMPGRSMPKDSTWQLRYTLKAHQGRVLSMAFIGDHILVSGGEDQLLFLYSMKTGRNIGRAYQGQFSPIISIAVSSTNQEIATGGLDGSIQRWQVDVNNSKSTKNSDNSAKPVARIEIISVNSVNNDQNKQPNQINQK